MYVGISLGNLPQPDDRWMSSYYHEKWHLSSTIDFWKLKGQQQRLQLHFKCKCTVIIESRTSNSVVVEKKKTRLALSSSINKSTYGHWRQPTYTASKLCSRFRHENRRNRLLLGNNAISCICQLSGKCCIFPFTSSHQHRRWIVRRFLVIPFNYSCTQKLLKKTQHAICNSEFMGSVTPDIIMVGSSTNTKLDGSWTTVNTHLQTQNDILLESLKILALFRFFVKHIITSMEAFFAGKKEGLQDMRNWWFRPRRLDFF